MKYLVLPFVFFMLGLSSGAQNLFINEIVSSNQSGEMDDFFENDDWIEIYNSGGLVNLAGYYLSDDPMVLDKWQIPSTDLGVTYVLPNDYLILWIDKDPQQGEDHVDFSLSSDGESLFLVAPDGSTIIDYVAFPQMAPDISYGRVSDGNAQWTFFTIPTFDAANSVIAQPTDILFINEVQTVNTSTYHDQQFEYDQWLEIYNPNAFQVNLAGYTFEVGNQIWQVPNTTPYWTVIPGGGFATVWFDGDTGNESNHASFNLPVSGGTIVLKGPDQSTVDQLTYPQLNENKSYGRQSDGSPVSVVFNVPTPRVSNTTIFIQPAQVYINEVMPQNGSTTTDNFDQFEDWFEVYNPGSTPVNLSGYYFSDNPGNPMKWQVPGTFADSVTVPAQGWRLFWADEDMTQGVLHASFRLSNVSECLSLYGPDGFTMVDEICWSGIGADSSYGRITDGSPDWWLFTGPTPEASNDNGILEVSNNENPSFRLFPNPSRDIVQFNHNTTVNVYSADGRFMHRFVRVNQLDVSQWISGVYVLRKDDGMVCRLLKD